MTYATYSMSAKEFRHSIRKYGKRLSRMCAAVAPQFDENAVHRIRTTVKKFRALLRFGGRKGHRGLRPDFKELYRLLGDLRNTQLLLGELHGNPPELSAWARDHAATLERRWTVLYDPGIIRQQTRDAGEPTKTVGRKRLKAFLKKGRVQVRSLLRQKPLDDDTVHAVRKAMKDMQYTLEWFKRPSSLDHVNQETGAFVDSRMGITLVDQGIGEGLSTPAILQLREKMEHTKSKRKQRAVRAVNQWKP